MQQNNSNPGNPNHNQLNQDWLRAQQDHFQALCYKVFEQNNDGKELIQLLKKSLIEKQAVADPEQSERYAYFREGQNHLIRSLLYNVEQHQEQAKQAAKEAE